MSARSSIYRLLLITLFAWSGLLLFTYFVEPQSLLTLIIFFLIVSVALTSTSAIIAYGIGRYLLPARLYHTTIRRAIRQGALLSLAVVLNLILRILHSGSIFTAVMIIGAVVVIEMLILAKR